VQSVPLDSWRTSFAAFLIELEERLVVVVAEVVQSVAGSGSRSPRLTSSTVLEGRACYVVYRKEWPGFQLQSDYNFFRT